MPVVPTVEVASTTMLEREPVEIVVSKKLSDMLQVMTQERYMIYFFHVQ
ncbi:MAG: hypothetical protein ACOYM3_04705 [Terrimicrobiaceae bacterium]